MALTRLLKEQILEMNRTCPALAAESQTKRGYPAIGLGDLIDGLIAAVNAGGGAFTGRDAPGFTVNTGGNIGYSAEFTLPAGAKVSNALAQVMFGYSSGAGWNNNNVYFALQGYNGSTWLDILNKYISPVQAYQQGVALSMSHGCTYDTTGITKVRLKVSNGPAGGGNVSVADITIVVAPATAM